MVNFLQLQIFGKKIISLNSDCATKKFETLFNKNQKEKYLYLKSNHILNQIFPNHQNAASIAALFLTTEAVIADKPEPKSAAPAAPGGDMDF